MSTFRLTIFALLLLALSACGSDSSTNTSSDDGPGEIDDAGETDDAVETDDPATLDGTYWSVLVLENGVERALVDGTRIEISFDGSQIGASAGCNGIGGSFSLGDDGVLTTTELFMTEMGCDVPLQEQDRFLIDFLDGQPTIEAASDSLTLTTDTATIELVNREIADPDLSLIGRRWTLESFFDASVAQSANINPPASLMFIDDSNLEGFDGCVEFTMSVEVSDGSTGGPITNDADGEILFGQRTDSSDIDCDDDLTKYSADFGLVLSSQATYVIDGTRLDIAMPNGTGLVFRTNEG